jgi:hypothetical protein
MRIDRLDLLCALGLVFLLCAGCGKKAEKAVTVEEVPQVMEEAFKEAQPQVSQQVTQVISSVREDNPKALSELQSLTERSELTEAQRVAADKAMYALLKRLQEAAQKGDQKADAELQKYRATK